jgi:hypothetical protein
MGKGSSRRPTDDKKYMVEYNRVKEIYEEV